MDILKVQQLPLCTVSRLKCPLSHGIRHTRVWEHSAFHQPPHQALRETPAPFTDNRRAVKPSSAVHHCVSLLKENKTCVKSKVFASSSDLQKAVQTGNMHLGICDMLRRSEQVSQWDDAAQLQWSHPPALSLKYNLSLKYGNKNLSSPFYAFPIGASSSE